MRKRAHAQDPACYTIYTLHFFERLQTLAINAIEKRHIAKLEMIRELIMQEKCDNRSTQQLRAMNMTTLGARDRSRSPCIVLSVCQTREKKRREIERERER